MAILKRQILFFCATMISLISCGQSNKVNSQQAIQTNMKEKPLVSKTVEEWKNQLSPEQFNVLREKGTERAFSGKFYLNTEKGMYVCGACGNELFTSAMKFESSCGWPSFDKEIEGGKIITQRDTSHGMTRTEIMCGKCHSHLGHLFDDGPTETGMRYCVNSLSLDFKPDTVILSK